MQIKCICHESVVDLKVLDNCDINKAKGGGGVGWSGKKGHLLLSFV